MLKNIHLQNFRSYKKETFSFEETTLIVGPNTAGKTNILEAVYLLSTGKSFRTEKDIQMLMFNQEYGRVRGESDDIELEVLITNGLVNGKSQFKKFLVNKVPKRRVDFIGNLLSVIFSPSDLDIVIGSPGLRRNFLDEVLEQVDREYRVAFVSFIKALRQRNALLEDARETGNRNEKQFEFWDNLVIENGKIVTAKRQEFIDFVNSSIKDIFDFVINYDKSEISVERLLQYKSEELASGVTLVGPHRDDFSISMVDDKTLRDVKFYGSRGQQRLAILQLKTLESQFIEEKLSKKPMLILDDIFSELDEGHINLILGQVGRQQIIISTTHREFVPKRFLKSMKIIQLEK